MNILIGLGIFAFILILVIVYLYNQIVNVYNSVRRAWADVLTQERQRGRIIPELEKALKEHTDFESDLQTKITKLRQGIDSLRDDEIDTQKYREITQVSKELMGSINVAVENYPNLKASESFAKYMHEITNQEDNVGAALRIFNQNVEEFNSLLQRIPTNLINSWFNKKAIIEVFSDQTAESSFDYKPNF